MKLAKHGKRAARPLAPVSRAWMPFLPLQRLQADFERLFEEPLGEWLTPTPLFESWEPPVEVYEDKNKLLVKLELPGMKKEEMTVSMSQGRLTISGERKAAPEAKGPKGYQGERYFGYFSRSIELPAPIAEKRIEAHYKDGVLTVTCPKAEEAKGRQVEIKVD